MFEYSLGQVGAEGVRWGQAYLYASVVASMDRVSSGSLVCSCDLYIGSWGGGGRFADYHMHGRLIFMALIQGKVHGLLD